MNNRDSTQEKYLKLLEMQIAEALNYIEDVMDERDEKVLSIIRETLQSVSRFHSTNREAKPPFIYPLVESEEGFFPFLDCEEGKFDKWKRRIRLLADKMSNINRK